jgi:ribose transport system permease protein
MSTTDSTRQPRQTPVGNAAPAEPAVKATARPLRATRQDLLPVAARTAMVPVLAVVLVGATVLYPGFWAVGNVKNILAQNAPLGIMAVGMTFAMITGGFDLSAGAVYACGAVSAAEIGSHLPLWMTVPITVCIGGMLGLVNGLIVTRLRVNPFVATLGTSFVFGGGAFLLTHSAPVLVTRPGFQALGQGHFAGLPTAVWVAAAVFVLGGLLLARTVYGQNLYAVGGNIEAARLSGLRVDTLRVSTYVFVGAAAALGGAILSSRIGVGQADVGTAVTLQVIAVVVIGGTSLFGGEGAVWRTAVGVLILSVISNVADSRGWNSNVEDVITGVIVVAAVALDSAARNSRHA